jgi:hypothetical protein
MQRESRLATVVGHVARAACALIAGVGMMHAQTNPKLDMPEGMREVQSVVLTSDSLGSAVGKLGPAMASTIAENGDSSRSLCYRVGDAERPTMLVFSSHDHIGGAGHIIDEILVVRADSSKFDPQLCALTRESAIPRTPDGLRLGMSMEEVRQLLGREALGSPKTAIYSWVTDSPTPSNSAAYAHWNSDLAECYRKGSKKIYARGQVVVRSDDHGIYSFQLTRGPMTCCCGIGAR